MSFYASYPIAGGATSGGDGTVTQVSVVTAHGISGIVANPTTTPAITLTLGDITPSTVNGNTITTGTGTLTLSTHTITAAGDATISGTNSGNVTLAAVGSSPNANAASLSSQVLTLQPFDSTHPGVVPLSGGGSTNYLRADGTWAAPPGATSGTVTSVSVVTANGVSGSVATATTTPAITLTLGAITPSSVNASGTVAGSNLSGTNSGDITLTAVGSLPSANAATLSGQALTLQPFDSTHPGITPLSGGGTTNFLRADGTWAAPPGATSGTVTSVSVASANGFAGTVATATTTPAITISTSVSGILFGNGTSVAAAIAANFPTLNQNTTGTAANITGTTNSSITTLSSLSLPASQITGVLPAANVGLTRTINAQSGTTYTFVLGDGSAAGGNPLVTFGSGSSTTVTVPTNASVAFPVGTQIDCIQQGAGTVTFAAAGGVTLNSNGGLIIGAQYVGVSLIKTATNVWTIVGYLT